MEPLVRSAVESDAAAVADIYNPYIRDSIITFEIETITESEMAARIGDTVKSDLPWLVAEVSGRIVGYAYASKWRSRLAYRNSVESTIYLSPSHFGRGIGLELYTALVDAIRARSMHAVIGGIALPNDRSVHLHEKLGFKKVAHFEQVGWKLNRWIDVGYWELLLEA